MALTDPITGQCYSASCSAIIHQRQASAPALINYEQFEPQQQHFSQQQNCNNNDGSTQQQQQHSSPSQNQMPSSHHFNQQQHMANAKYFFCF